jgi:hypothetical protein
MSRLSRIFIPTLVVITVYTVVNKLFLERISDINSQNDLRGGNIIRNYLVKKIFKKILHDRAIKIALITVCASGIGGLTLFLEALYRLLQEGKISRALYEQILKNVARRWTKVPIDHLL